MSSTIAKIVKRDKTVVDFTPDKIVLAIRKAFIEVRHGADEMVLTHIAAGIVHELEQVFANKTLMVENIQDAVEKHLMQAGYFDVAKAYILYRYEHAKERAAKKEETLEKVEQGALSIVKRSGKKEAFSIDKLRKSLMYAVKGLEKEIDVEAILKQCRQELFEDITTDQIARALIMTVRSTIELDPAYSTAAARLLLDRIYKEVLGPDFTYPTLVEDHVKAFTRNIKRGIELGQLDPRLLCFDLEKLSRMFKLDNDHLFEYMGLEFLYSRYLMEDSELKKPLETPQMFWMRIAMGTALPETAAKRDEVTKDFYEIMSEFYYTPGGRTLFQAGTIKPQLSNCFLNVVPDSLDAIFKTYADNAQLLKWSGGTGTSWTPVRGTGSFIKGTGVGSQGVVPFLKIANDVNVCINRSGKRRGAGCVYLETWHYDIEDFLELRKNTGDERRRTHDINTANWIPDLFMKRVREGKDWTLFSPHEVPDLHEIYGREFEERYAFYEKQADEGKIKTFKRISAPDLWKKMLTMLFETGHPWITFKDPCNVRSPQSHVGVVHNSNLCTEITLNTSAEETAVCNLGSINFAKFMVNGVFDKEVVGRVVRSAIRMLDNVIDVNYYPIPETERSNNRHRPLGLGVRGYHDALYMLGKTFDSQEAVEFADESMEIVSYYTILASSELAKERGAYKTFRGSKWSQNIFPQDTIDLLEKERGEEIPLPRGGKMDWTPVREHVKLYGMRNSNVMAIAPTASTANLVGCIPCVEPIYKNIYVKSSKEGDFVVVNNYLVEDLKKLGLWSKSMLDQIKYHDGSVEKILEIPANLRAKYKEVFEINPRWLIEAAARRMKWIDQSQSLNIFFRGLSGRELSEIYFYAWKLGLKTTYYLRTLAVSQVEKSTVDTQKFGSTHTRQSSDSGHASTAGAISATVPTAPVSTPSVSAELSLAGVKACSIADPTCESCQS
jgi:ribonucleoside-diphosphate reductase alpha chain